jgi:hypothetical protein
MAEKLTAQQKAWQEIEDGPTRALPFTMFRETLVLPLRLNDRRARAQLDALLHEPPAGWAEASDNMAFVDPSKLWRAALADTGANAYERTQAYGEMAFFHPFVQRWLYGSGVNEPHRAIRSFRRTGIDTLTVEAGYDHPQGQGAKSFALTLAVERIEMHHVRDPGIVCFVVELACDANAPLQQFGMVKDEETGELRRTPLDGEQRASLREVLLLRDALRRLYPPYFKQLTKAEKDGPAVEWNETLFPLAVTLGHGAQTQRFELTGADANAMADGLIRQGELPVASWWAAVFAPVIGARAKDGSQLLVQVVDERMPNATFLAVPQGETLSRGDRVRLCFADGPGWGLGYHRPFMENFERDHHYDRFAHFGTDYYVSSYSFTTLVSTGIAPGTARAKAKFDFGLDIVQEHARRHYLRMFMITHVQRAILLACSNWINAAITGHDSLREAGYRMAIDDLRQSFATFSQTAWFSNISNQEQPRELFALMQARAGSATLHDEVASELERARNILEDIDDEREAEAAIGLNAIAGVAALVGVPGALIAIHDTIGTLPPWLKAAPAQALAALLIVSALLVFLAGHFQSEGVFYPKTWRQWRALLKRPGLQVVSLVSLLCLLGAILLWFAG